jgi:SRSO17 transposase
VASGWRLYLPESWAKDRQRREEAGIPPDVKFQTKWQLGLDIIDQVRGWGLADRIVVGDAGYGDATEFRDGLETRGLPYIVGISSALGVWTKPPAATVPPPHSGRGAPATRYAYGQAATHLGARGGSEGKRVEDNSLAARHEGMVGVALRGDAGTAIAWVRPWATATPRIMVAGGMAGVGERAH